MTTAVWVGRIGVLAAALGAGAVIGFGTCAEASAAPADSSGPTSRAPTAEGAPAPTRRTPAHRDRAVRSSAVAVAMPTAWAASAVAVVTASAPTSTPVAQAATAALTWRESRRSAVRSTAPAPARGLSLPWSDPRGRQITIYKGTHFAIPNSTGLFVKETVGTGTFITNSAYDLQDVDQFDWNKFTGITFTPLEPDRNAAMVGWRYNLSTQEFEVGPYYNVDKARISPNPNEVITVPVGETFQFDVDYAGITLSYADQRVYKPYPPGLTANVWTAARVSGWFGGNEVAPRTVSYFLRLT
ncbi:MAG: hypothetical protein WD228_10430 [Mycobacterium sp.]